MPTDASSQGSVAATSAVMRIGGTLASGWSMILASCQPLNNASPDSPIATRFGFRSKVRVYAISSVPEGQKNLPGILHIHGGGQTVNPGWLRFWNERGYAALTFNWGGKWPGRDKFADWGKLTQGNHRDRRHHVDGDEAVGTRVIVVSLDSSLATRLDVPRAHGGDRPEPIRNLWRLDGRYDRLAVRGDG